MDRWRGKVAVVTGASAGIGAAIAEKLVEEGIQVVGFARRSERVEELSKKLKAKKGKLHAIKVDITKEEDIVQAFKWVAQNLGPVHILINNAGILQQTNLVEGDTEKWRKVLETNVLGLCIATREAVKMMRANNIDGHIIHMNSIGGHYVPNYPGTLNVYPASKHAVTALTETLRKELNNIGAKIKITSLSPGLVATDIFEANNSDPKTQKALQQMAALTSVDVADATLYVLSTPPHVHVQELIMRAVGELL